MKISSHTPPFPYEDIIDTQWPPQKRDRALMPKSERAKIFAPFAALKGFDKAIDIEATLHKIAVEEENKGSMDEP